VGFTGFYGLLATRACRCAGCLGSPSTSDDSWSDRQVAKKCVQITMRLAHATATDDGARYARAA